MILSSQINHHQTANLEKPVLYSFRRCPFAIRARLVLKVCEISVLLREIELSDKPQCMIAISSKATVPILKLPNKILDQSMDIIFWALSYNDPCNILNGWMVDKEYSEYFLDSLDNEFKNNLDRYKYSSRYKLEEEILHRNKGLLWIEELEKKLKNSEYLSGDKKGIFDYISFPFIRQYRIADTDWFDRCDLPNVQKWLSEFEQSPLFQYVMKKMPIWKKTGKEVEF